MSDDVARAFAFMELADMAGTRSERSTFGKAVSSAEVPLRQDSNFLLVDRADATAPELATELARLQLRAIVVPDEALGERLGNGFAELGWNTHRQVVMVHRRAATRIADTGLPTEVDETALRHVRREAILAEPWGSPELADQLLYAKCLIGTRIGARFFAVLADGKIVAATDLYLAGDTAQIEDVSTIPDHRNRGYASALVLRAVEEAHRAGATFVFLVARDDDWPKELYGQLGFDVAGRYFKFFT